jgi:hypothetical protein
MVKRVLAAALSVFQPFSSQIADPTVAKSPAAHVLSVRGEWVSAQKPHRLITNGDALPPGTEIKPQKTASESDFIVLVDADNHVIQRRCNVDRCNQPLLIAKSSRPSPFSQVINVVAELWRGDEKRYRSLLSRGMVIPDGVLELSDDSLKVCALFAGSQWQRHRIELEPLHVSVAARSLQLDVNCDPAQPTGVAASGLEPGLYSLQLLNTGANTSPALGEKTWVLVVRPPAFEQVNSRFTYARGQTLSWKETAGPSVVRSFLRAYLDYLSTHQLQAP